VSTVPALAHAQATKDVLAMAALEVDLSKIEMGQTVTVKWRGKPVFVRRRSEQEVEAANKARARPAGSPAASLPRMHSQRTDHVLCRSGESFCSFCCGEQGSAALSGHAMPGRCQ
jgi:Rieske Fe-S protein